MIVLLGPAPRSGLEACIRIEALMVERGVHACYVMAPRSGQQLRKSCDICAHAKEVRGGTSFFCRPGRRRSTYGASRPCRSWTPRPGIMLYDADTGTAYLPEDGDESSNTI